MTLRETLQAEIATAESALAEKRAALAALEEQAGSWLGHEVETLKHFFASIKEHLL